MLVPSQSLLNFASDALSWEVKAHYCLG